MTLRNKVALVTGSSRGIGAGIARVFSDRGARVVLHGRDREALDRMHTDITRAGGRAIKVTGDLTDAGEIERMRTRIERAFGSVEVLVANAGGIRTGIGPVEDVSEATWRSTVDVNLTAAFLTIKSVLPGMKDRGAGNVVTISSGSAHAAHERSPVAYAAAKAGLEMLTKNVALQGGPHGVRANCIAPETIMTEANQTKIAPDVHEQLIERHPIRRLGTPDDVADAAAFLASDESAWITGTVIDVAGGAVL